MFPSVNAAITLHPGSESIDTITTYPDVVIQGQLIYVASTSVVFQGILEKPLKVEALMVS
jgi:hypothetical protein